MMMLPDDDDDDDGSVWWKVMCTYICDDGGVDEREHFLCPPIQYKWYSSEIATTI